MTEPIRYAIALRGKVGARSLRPLLDNFSFDRSEEGVTRLAGHLSDASQLHGVVIHLVSMNIEIISIYQEGADDIRSGTRSATTNSVPVFSPIEARTPGTDALK